MSEVKLGDRVKDNVSGFTGVAVSRHDYINGCTRSTVQPQIDKNGRLPDAETFDALQLKVTEATVAKSDPRGLVPGALEVRRHSSLLTAAALTHRLTR